MSLLFYELHLWNNGTEVGLVEVEVICPKTTSCTRKPTDAPPSSYGSVLLGPRTLINQSALVYADANTAKLSPCPYQLKQSIGQSIILGVTQHVAKVACAQNVHLVFNMHAWYRTVHASLLNMQLLSNFLQMKRIEDEIEGAHSFASIQWSFNNVSTL